MGRGKGRGVVRQGRDWGVVLKGQDSLGAGLGG